MTGLRAPAAGLIAVFDTNALLPLLVGKSKRAMFLQQAWQARQFLLVNTPPILDELSRVMRYPRVRQQLSLTEADIDEALVNLRRRSCNLPGVVEGVMVVRDDPSDNVFVACALEAAADYLVTQDPHLLALKYHHGTQIVSLDLFARILRATGSLRE